jgi:hypothetical protein
LLESVNDVTGGDPHEPVEGVNEHSAEQLNVSLSVCLVDHEQRQDVSSEVVRKLAAPVFTSPHFRIVTHGPVKLTESTSGNTAQAARERRAGEK